MATRTSDRRRRIVVLGSYAPSLTNFRGPLLAEMVRRGHEVYALAAGIGAVREQLEAIGVTAVDVELVNSSLNPIAALRTTKNLTGVLRGIGPDTVIAYTIKPIVLGAPAARAAGVPTFVALVTGLGYAFTRGTEIKRLISRAAASLLYGRAFAMTDLAIFQNSDDRAVFRRLRLLPHRLRTAIVDGSGVNTSHFAPAPVPADVSFLMIARLLRDKGVREYAEATRLLKARHPHVRVTLVGGHFPSPDCLSEPELQRVLEAGVDWRGPQEDVRGALAEHSVYVLPSYREGTPRSVLEALAVGRPVITTDAPGCRETVIDGVNGFLVPPRDAERLCQAMVRFIENPDLIPAMAAESLRIAREKYDVRKVNADLLELIGL